MNVKKKGRKLSAATEKTSGITPEKKQEDTTPEEKHEDTTPEEKQEDTTPEIIQNNNDEIPCSSGTNLENIFNSGLKPTTTSKVNQSQLTQDRIISPNIAATVASNQADMLSQISYPTELLNALLMPPPVVPIESSKKSSVPHIVQSKDRPQVIKKAKAIYCKDGNYGVNMTASLGEEDNNCHTKSERPRRSIFINPYTMPNLRKLLQD